MSAAIAVTLGLAYSWIAAGFHPFTWPMRVAVAVPVLGAMVFWWHQRGPADEEARPRAAGTRWCIAAWIGLLVAAVTWELIALFSSPREEHPTLSSIGDDIMRTHPGRAATFAVWLLVGWLLFVRPVGERRR